MIYLFCLVFAHMLLLGFLIFVAVVLGFFVKEFFKFICRFFNR